MKPNKIRWNDTLPLCLRSSAAWLASALFLVWLEFASIQAQTINTASLIDQMTDLSALAEMTPSSFTCKQFSSYDRKSKSPTEDWFANGDSGQYLRVETNDGRKEYVMMEASGPGALVRIWSANPAGVLRIYLDGANKPVLESPMSELLGGQFSGLPRPIAGEYGKGWNLYFPIPYAKSCKITSDKGDFFYHVNYRTYPPGATVESFQLSQIRTLSSKIEKLASRLDDPRGADASLGGETIPLEWVVPAGQASVQEFEGPKAITWFSLRLLAKNRDAALRSVIVKARFDHENCVEAPIGDFFGSAPGINPFTALPLGMSKDGEMYCHWFMPFQKTAVIQLINLGQEDVALRGSMGLKDYAWKGASMYFHAKWRVQFDVPSRPMIDWNYLTANGQGLFVGVSFAIDNPVKDWWGEGDEKIYVDGETFPSHFGTGTEDYFGYAWCWPGLFTHAYHAQPRCDGPRNYGRTSVNRFHIIDCIPFTKNFKFDIELWHWNKACKVNMAVTAYWYAKAGAADTFQGLNASDAMIRPMPEYVVPCVPGAIEGEKLKIIRVTGVVSPQDWDLSAGSHLWWHEGMKPGDVLVVSFPVPKAGKFKVFGRFLSASDYGIHQLAINGKKAGGPIDFYNPDVKPTKEIDLGTYELKDGDNEFSATIVGANEKAVKAFMLGLDYLLLQPVD